MAEGVLLVDGLSPEWRVLLASTHCLQALGLSRSQGVGRKLWDMLEVAGGLPPQWGLLGTCFWWEHVCACACACGGQGGVGGPEHLFVCMHLCMRIVCVCAFMEWKWEGLWDMQEVAGAWTLPGERTFCDTPLMPSLAACAQGRARKPPSHAWRPCSTPSPSWPAWWSPGAPRTPSPPTASSCASTPRAWATWIGAPRLPASPPLLRACAPPPPPPFWFSSCVCGPAVLAHSHGVWGCGVGLCGWLSVFGVWVCGGFVVGLVCGWVVYLRMSGVHLPCAWDLVSGMCVGLALDSRQFISDIW